jgi:hypothetical protein
VLGLHTRLSFSSLLGSYFVYAYSSADFRDAYYHLFLIRHDLASIVLFAIDRD